MESIPKLTFGMYCHASPTIPSIASKSSCPGTSRQKLITIHLALPELSRSACPDGLRLTLTFLIQLPPVEHLVGIHVVPSRHSRHRGSRHQRLFHNRPPLGLRSPPVLFCKRKSQTVWTS